MEQCWSINGWKFYLLPGLSLCANSENDEFYWAPVWGWSVLQQSWPNNTGVWQPNEGLRCRVWWPHPSTPYSQGWNWLWLKWQLWRQLLIGNLNTCRRGKNRTRYPADDSTVSLPGCHCAWRQAGEFPLSQWWAQRTSACHRLRARRIL